jgi:glycosyltransferase involved in cell wall biosynthesis
VRKSDVRLLVLSFGANVLDANLGGERERLAEYAAEVALIVQVSRSHRPHAAARVVVSEKYLVYAISGPRVFYPVRALGLGWQLIRGHRLNLIDTQEPVVTGTLGVLLKVITGIRLVIGCHSPLPRRTSLAGSLLDRVTKFVTLATLLRSDGVQAVSEAVREELVMLGVPRRKIAVISVPALTADHSLHKRRDEIRWDVLFVGRLSRRKAPTLLLEAVIRVQQRGIPARLAFVGDGPELERCRRMVVRAAEGTVTFLGVLDATGVGRAFARSRVLALPSSSEGFGRVLVEAASWGLPVVASNVDGVPEIVVDGVTGFLVPPNDSDALSDALARLLSDAELCASMGEAARLRAQTEFDRTRLISRLVGFWETVVAT